MHMNYWTLMTTVLLFFATVAAAAPPAVNVPVLSLDGARQIIAAGLAEATRLQAPGGSIAVVDSGGHLVALERIDYTFAASAEIAQGKARTAALFHKPTRVFEDLVNNGRTTMVALPDFTPLQGGVPIMVDGHVAGAVGVSGAASAQQDEDIARAAAAAFSMPGPAGNL